MVDYISEENNIVDEKIVHVSGMDHKVTLFYLDPNSTIMSNGLINQNEGWVVRLDKGDFLRGVYENEKMARLSFKLIDGDFIDKAITWRVMHDQAINFYHKVMDEHYSKVFCKESEN